MPVRSDDLVLTLLGKALALLPRAQAEEMAEQVGREYGATMAAGLEARVPYLDRRLVEYALHLPASAKIRRLKGKYVLRRIAAKYLPRPIVWRRKHGFIVPWEEWVRSPESPALDALLSDAAWSRWDVFDAAGLRSLRRRLAAGDRSADPGMLFRAAVLALWSRGL